MSTCKQVKIGDQEYPIRECTMRQVEYLDEWLEKLPRPDGSRVDIEGFKARVEALTGLVDHSNLGVDEAAKVGHLMNWRKQLAEAVASEAARAAFFNDDQWPPQMMSGGHENCLQSREGKRKLFFCILQSGTPEITEDDALKVYHQATSTEFGRAYHVFMNYKQDAEGGGEDADPKEGDGSGADATT